MNEKDHKIIEKPWDYNISSFLYNCSSENLLEHYIELVLTKDDISRKLRFIAPKQLKIEEGFPSPTHGMEILDIRERGMEDVNVYVGDFEASHGAITFYAKEVIEINEL